MMNLGSTEFVPIFPQLE